MIVGIASLVSNPVDVLRQLDLVLLGSKAVIDLYLASNSRV